MTPGTNGADSPLAAGGKTLSEDDQRLATIAAVAARLTLEEYRKEQKRGRQDRGSGDPVIGGIVRQYREDIGLSQEMLAERAGVHPTTIGKIETADRGMSLATFCRLYKVFADPLFADQVSHQIAHPL